MFNAARYVERAAAGELLVNIINSAPPAVASGEPPGTLSQRLRYSQKDGVVVAVAHRYLRPNGTLGGHGRPDPKIIFTPAGRLDVRHPDTTSCPDCPARVRRQAPGRRT